VRVVVILSVLAVWLGPDAVAEAKGVTLQPDRVPGMCVTLAGPQGESVSLPCDGSARQNFGLPETGVAGPITQDGLCLAVEDDNNYPPILAKPCDGSPEQTWTLSEERAVRNGVGRCLSLLGASSRTGEIVFGARCPTDWSAQTWLLKPGTVTNVIEASLESKSRPGMCIGHNSWLGLYPCSDGYGQVLSFDAKAPGQIRMKSSCFAGGLAFGTLGLSECHNNGWQRWTLLESGEVANELLECITLTSENGRDVLRALGCDGKPDQVWAVRRKPTTE
jgi:Ricin-type beta-trefoil lectin domain